MSQKIPTREEVLQHIFQSKTREQVIEARRIRDAYLKANPDDDYVFEASETLEMSAALYGLPVPDYGNEEHS